MRILRAVFVGSLVLCSAVAASAVPLSFLGALDIRIGTLPAITATGSGVGDFAGQGGAASIPANVFSIRATLPISPPLLVINGLGAGAPGQAGFRNLVTNPLNPGSNKSLSFGGITGKMALDLNAYLITNLGGTAHLPTTPTPTNLAAVLPISGIGFGCLAMKTAFGGCTGGGAGLAMGTLRLNPYQLGMVTVMGALQGVPSTAMGTGFDNRTTYGQGVLQLVTPAVVNLGALGSLASVTTLTLTIVPEPTTAALVGFGLVGLGWMRRRYRAS